jgi:hypothetical protein
MKKGEKQLTSRFETYLISSKCFLSLSLKNPSRYTTNGSRLKIRAPYASAGQFGTLTFAPSIANSDSFSCGLGDNEFFVREICGKKYWFIGFATRRRTANKPITYENIFFASLPD